MPGYRAFIFAVVDIGKEQKQQGESLPRPVHPQKDPGTNKY